MTEVPCNGCRLCCQHWFVPLDADETDYAWAFRYNPKNGKTDRVLMQKENGDCFYLDAAGCTIHGRAPRVCRDFDCRRQFAMHTRRERRMAIKDGEVTKEILDRGRELLRR